MRMDVELMPLPRSTGNFGLIANGPAKQHELDLSKSGLELLSTRRLRTYRVPLYWIVGESVVLQKSLDLISGVTRDARFDADCLKFAETCARAARLEFGTLWIFPDSDGGWHPGGLDLFPPQQYLGDGEMKMAAAIYDRYVA